MVYQEKRMPKISIEFSLFSCGNHHGNWCTKQTLRHRRCQWPCENLEYRRILFTIKSIWFSNWSSSFVDIIRTYSNSSWLFCLFSFTSGIYVTYGFDNMHWFLRKRLANAYFNIICGWECGSFGYQWKSVWNIWSTQSMAFRCWFSKITRRRTATIECKSIYWWIRGKFKVIRRRISIPIASEFECPNHDRRRNVD